MAVNPDSFKQVLGRFATGVTIVTTTDQSGQRRGLTANAFMSVSLDPPLVLFGLNRSSGNFQAFQDSDAFAVNILRDDQRSLAEWFARSGDDKFQQGNWEEGETGVPVLTDALARLECTKWQVYDGGDHILVVGQVQALHVGDGSPLLYYRGRLLDPPASMHPSNLE